MQILQKSVFFRIFASLRGTKQSSHETNKRGFTLDCFVVPPRNDAKRVNDENTMYNEKSRSQKL